MNKSTHKAEVVQIKIEKHPNADKLGVVKVFGYTVCVGLDHWTDGQLAVYIVPDTIVDTARPEFAYLAADCKPGETKYRVKAKKLRQVPSFGILIPAPEGTKVGDDCFERLGLEHYEPPEEFSTGGEAAKAPECGYIPNYDVDALKRYVDKFVPGEPVVVTEKIHGASAKYTWDGTNMHVGSKSEWKKQANDNAWWKALRNMPGLEIFCKVNSDLVVYGEIYGAVQDLRYGCKPGEIKFAIFDLWHKTEQRWLNNQEYYERTDGITFHVPILGIIPFDMETINALAEGKTTMPDADHVREGVVVKPVVERTDLEIGRVCLKVVGLGYLDRRKK